MVNTGLEGVVVAETAISHVDGEAGRLVIRGVPVERLTGFEEAVALLLDGEPDLGEARARAWPLVARAHEALRAKDGMVALRAGLALVEDDDPAYLVAATAVLCAARARRRAGLDPVRPDPSLPHAHDLLRMALGQADEPRATALGRYLGTVVDHGMNASTFTARVVASTGSDAASAVVAALGALKGPLHGGAPGPVLDMLDAVGTPERAERWTAGELAAGRRIMGMGHRVYRVRDPRAAVLEQAARDLGEAGVASDRLALARAVEQAAEAALAAHRPERRLRANVEFYTAVLLDAAGFDRSLFTPLFACGRVVGWLAHVAEQRATGRLIRPRARYVGP